MRSFCAGQARALGALWADPELARPRGAAAAPALGLHGRRVCPLSSIREIAQSHRDMEQELAHAVNASSKAMDRVYSKPRTAEVPAPFRSRPLRRSPRACCRVCVLVPAGADRQRCPGHGQQLQGSAQRDGAAAGREGGLGELGAGSLGGRPAAGCRGRGVLAQTEFQASGSPARCGRGLGPRGDCITGSASESCGHERLCRCRRPR